MPEDLALQSLSPGPKPSRACCSVCGLQSSSIGSTWKIVRDVESRITPQTHWTRICIFTTSSGDSWAHSRSSDLLQKRPPDGRLAAGISSRATIRHQVSFQQYPKRHGKFGAIALELWKAWVGERAQKRTLFSEWRVVACDAPSLGLPQVSPQTWPSERDGVIHLIFTGKEMEAHLAQHSAVTNGVGDSMGRQVSGCLA